MERALIFAGRVGLASFALVLVCAHTALALPEDVMVAKQNGLEVPAEKSEVNADIEAARWIATNLPANAIVMARHVPITYHYAHRKTVWFPPISSPPILMDGIRRLGVEYVLVIHRAYSYYLPADQDCFRPLQGAFPSSFTRVYAAGEFEVFKVEEAPSRDLQTRRDVSK